MEAASVRKYMEYQTQQIRGIVSKYRKNNKFGLLQKVSRPIVTSDTSAQAFVFDSSDHYIRKILLEQHWRVVPTESKNSSLKWVYAPKTNTFSELLPGQMINHFAQTHILTTKLGLKKTLTAQKSSFVDEDGTNHMSFFPRSYDLSEENQLFIKDFKRTAILNLLKKMMITIQLESPETFIRLNQQILAKKERGQVNWILKVKGLLDDEDVFEKRENKSGSSLKINGRVFESLLFYLALMFTLDSDFTEESFSKDQFEELVKYSLFNPPYRSFEEHYSSSKTLICTPTERSLILFFHLYRLTFERYPWFKPDGLRNIWVIKTSDSSRGRSIFLVESLQDIKMYNNGTRLIQKYIQNVWIFHKQTYPDALEQFPFMSKLDNKKFDIRLWVLVKSFCPLQAYIYQQGYLRISQDQYQLLNISNQKTHLTNFSVNWKSNPHDSQNSYILLSEYYAFLQKIEGTVTNKLKKQINKIVLQCLQSAETQITSHNPRSFELFGFDIILDAQLKPWLLEINMSPACKERGRLGTILEEMGTGLLSIVGLIPKDYRQNQWQSIVPMSQTINLTKKKSSKSKSKLYNPMSSKENINLYKSQCLINASLKKFGSLTSGQEKEVLQQSRINSMLPSISNSYSLHMKQEVNNQQLIVRGNKLSFKEFYNQDHYFNVLSATLTIQRQIKIKEKSTVHAEIQKKKKDEKLYPLNFLKLLEVLAKIVKKRQGKSLKRVKKVARKRKHAN